LHWDEDAGTDGGHATWGTKRITNLRREGKEDARTDGSRARGNELMSERIRPELETNEGRMRHWDEDAGTDGGHATWGTKRITNLRQAGTEDAGTDGGQA
jgi:hypothetical protein